jgi:hypothetical protein
MKKNVIASPRVFLSEDRSGGAAISARLSSPEFDLL